ncbi:oligosaccharide flippase family protein [Photobacterium lutimaris]|uniref:Uncharacterized protein n=1 Tax=Photobacterium lutimaris TaxID=388278 RepID=A0A2T3INB7_9GAMM|nr:oligosaccharide flippase family protein [Photobacterium lutimaris]PSU29836.1 hypothetical protein C9I99_24185 [Photobacterium lutimaris]TDR75261.1 O-antigen/teichoic acid export membrane protein [Photobacterium lutimaris]
MKQFIKYVSSLWLSSLLTSLLAFSIQASLARTLSPSELGEFNGTLSYLLVFGALAGFGVDNALLKIFGKGKTFGNKFGKSVVIYSISTTVISLLLLVFFSTYIFSGVNKDNLFILAPILISLVSFNVRSAVLQVERRYHELALWQIINNGSKLFFILFIFSDYAKPDDIYYLYSLSSLMIFLISISSFTKLYKGKVSNYEPVAIGISPYRVKKVGLLSIPFGLAGIAHTIYFQSDVFLLSYLNSSELAGFYSISLSIITAVYLFPAVIYQKILLPRIHEWSNNDGRKMLNVFQVGNGVMLITGFLAAIAVFILSEPIIKILFGSSYEASIKYLKLLSICIPLRFVISGFGSVLSTGNLIRYKLICMIVVAIFNAVLNVVFIPEYGVYAAITSTVLSEIFLLLLFVFTVFYKLFGMDTFKGWFYFSRGTLNV